MTNTLKIYGYRCPQDDDVMPTDLAQECQNDEGFAYTDPLVRLKDVRELVQKGGSRAAAGWQPIETAPKGKPTSRGGSSDPAPSILLFVGGYPIVGFWAWDVEGWIAEEGSRDGWITAEGSCIESEFGKPTHWMPLPESPTP